MSSNERRTVVVDGREITEEALVAGSPLVHPHGNVPQVSSTDGALSHFDAEQTRLIKEQLCKGATDNELRLFVSVCQRTGLDPFTGQIHAVKRWDQESGGYVMAIQIGIDGYRLQAERSGEYEGQTPPEWCGPDGVWSQVWLSKDVAPVAARAGVYRTGFRDAMYAVALWASYAQRKMDGDITKMWRTHGPGMLAKCAEALALRKAFPRDLSGIYTDVEMGQADTPEEAPAVPQPKRVEAAPVKKDDPAPTNVTGLSCATGFVTDLEEKDRGVNKSGPWELWVLTLHVEDGPAKTGHDRKFSTFSKTVVNGAGDAMAEGLLVDIGYKRSKKDYDGKPQYEAEMFRLHEDGE